MTRHAASHARAASLLIASLAAAARAGDETAGGVTVLADSMNGSHEFRHGCIEHRVRLQNQAPEPRRVTVELRSNWGSGDYLASMTRHLVVPAGGTVRVSLPQPPLDLNTRVVQVHVPGHGTAKTELPSLGCGLRPAYRRHGGSRGEPPVMLVSRGLNQDHLKDRLNRPSESPPPTAHAGDGELKLVKSESDTAAWSENWLAYTCFDGVLLSQREYDGLRPAVAAALRQYVEGGGTLTVFGGSVQAPQGAAVRPVPQAQQAGKNRRTKPYSLDGLQAWHVGFGRFLACSQTDLWLLDEPQATALLATWRAASDVWVGAPDLQEAHAQFKIIDHLAVPVRGLAALMVLFSIVIGPLNVVWLARRNRRLWLFWTVPAISLVTCLLVLGYSLLVEGTRPTLRVEALTLLDEAAGRAVTVGGAGVYCPLTPADGLRFAAETEVTPCTTRSYRDGTGRGIDLTSGQHLSAGWVLARVPAYFVLRKCEPRRERLPLSFADGRPASVVNGLGAPITRLWVADAQGRVWTAAGIAAGARAELSATALPPRSHTEAAAPEALLHNNDWFNLVDKMTRAPADWLQPGSYLVELVGSPFLEGGLPADRTHARSRALVLGCSGE